MTDPKPDSQDFDMLVVDTFGPKVLLQIQSGELPIPERLCQQAMVKAKEHFDKACKSDKIKDILLYFALCRQLLDDLKARFGDLDISENEIKSLEQNILLMRNQSADDADPMDLQQLDEYITNCLYANKRYLD